MLTIHPPSFIETEDCDGPRYTRGQPSRENAGVLMEDKYVTEFELPMRNLKRYTKEIKNNWNRLTPEQRAIIMESFDIKETFANEIPSDEVSSDEVMGEIIKMKTYLDAHPKSSGALLDLIMDNQNDSVAKNDIMKWNIKNFEKFNLNWKSGLIVSILLLIIICLIVYKMK
jgi:hypothetical protein